MEIPPLAHQMFRICITVTDCIMQRLLIHQIVDAQIPQPFSYNVITPDTNGQNDVLFILNANRIRNPLTVFNRWGLKVYEAVNFDNTYDGENLSDGTNFYIFSYCEELTKEY